jgi:hypothetical protein
MTDIETTNVRADDMFSSTKTSPTSYRSGPFSATTARSTIAAADVASPFVAAPTVICGSS